MTTPSGNAISRAPATGTARRWMMYVVSVVGRSLLAATQVVEGLVVVVESTMGTSPAEPDHFSASHSATSSTKMLNGPAGNGFGWNAGGGGNGALLLYPSHPSSV